MTLTTEVDMLALKRQRNEKKFHQSLGHRERDQRFVKGMCSHWATCSQNHLPGYTTQLRYCVGRKGQCGDEKLETTPAYFRWGALLFHW